jgi:hypothetical protein
LDHCFSKICLIRLERAFQGITETRFVTDDAVALEVAKTVAGDADG